jgi:predicted Rossmann-fold nucleotide-binding protein
MFILSVNYREFRKKTIKGEIMKRICVFCGSSHGTDPAYVEAAKKLARCFVEKKLELVYGGSNLGLMGVLANGVLNNHGTITAITPEDLKRRVGH